MTGSVFRRFLGGRCRRGGAGGEEPLKAVIGAQFMQHEVDQLGPDERQHGEMRAGLLETGAFEENDRTAVGLGQPEIADDAAFLQIPDDGGLLP